MKQIFLDGDVLCYQAAGQEASGGVSCEAYLQDFISRLRAATMAEPIVVLTGPGSTKRDRYKWATTKAYQGNRRGAESVPAPLKKRAHTFLRTLPGTLVSDTYEADDILTDKLLTGQAIWTIDKDLRQTAGLHTDRDFKVHRHAPSSAGEPEDWYGPAQLAFQLLTGDKADNIPGLKYGPVKAAEALGKGDTPLDRVAELYDAAGKPPAYFAEQFALLSLGSSSPADCLVRLYGTQMTPYVKQAHVVLLQGPPKGEYD